MTYFELSTQEWTARADKHQTLIAPLADAFLKRRCLNESHPVHDFLFTYYSFSPSKLKNWVPSINEKLFITTQDLNEYSWLTGSLFCIEKNTLTLNRERIYENTYHLSNFIASLCHNILNQAPRFNCFGLHEWAMVYKLSSEDLRHKSYPLRLSSQEINCFVESQKICCSHYDAYRFFTKDAHSLNVLNPTLETRLQMEQGGCLHANMDLYKWATKLWPWIGSDFIAKTFFLAVEGRELDMRASPYDLKKDGYSPLSIETEDGRKQYQKEQQILTEKANCLRKELLSFCQEFKVLVKSYCPVIPLSE